MTWTANGDDLVGLLGKTSDDPDVLQALSDFSIRHPPELDEPEEGLEDERQWFVWRPSSKLGFEFGFQDEARRLCAVAAAARADQDAGLGLGSAVTLGHAGALGTSGIRLPRPIPNWAFEVPMSLTFIPRADLADAAGLNSFVRQIGGSLGLSIFATVLSTYTARASAAVSWTLSPLRTEVVARAMAIKSMFMARGLAPVEAQAVTLKALAAVAMKQGLVLAFEKTFLLQGVVFVVVLPLLFFLRVGKSKTAEPIDMSME